MSTTQILFVAFAVIALLAAAAIFAVAWRRSPRAEARAALDPAAVRRDRTSGEEEAPEPAAVAVALDDEDPPPIDPLELRTEVTEEQYGVTRRQFFNRGILAVFGIFLAQFGIASLAFMWPKLSSGGFGGKVNAGKLSDIESLLFDSAGRVQPLFIPAAQSYILPFQANVAGTAFDGKSVVASGLVALWQRCVHLGCRVPWCDSSIGFECPCHGSKYNAHGEYEDGPAPRNLDRFIVTVNDADELIIDTSPSAVVETPRSTSKTIEYPQGPSCI